MLRYVDPTRTPGLFARSYAAFAAGRFARFISRHINWKIDPLLLRVTRGGVATTLVFPTALLETRGARSGARRRNAIIYFHDGDRVIIVASNAGSSKHPAWYHNLSAHPDVTLGGIPMRATAVNDEAERERLWVLADRVFPAFASYRYDAANAGRRIPIVQLTRLACGDYHDGNKCQNQQQSVEADSLTEIGTEKESDAAHQATDRATSGRRRLSAQVTPEPAPRSPIHNYCQYLGRGALISHKGPVLGGVGPRLLMTRQAHSAAHRCSISPQEFGDAVRRDLGGEDDERRTPARAFDTRLLRERAARRFEAARARGTCRSRLRHPSCTFRVCRDARSAALHEREDSQGALRTR